MSLIPTIRMMNKFCTVLIDIERGGIHIDTEALDALDIEYEIRYNTLKNSLDKLAREAMGDRPINLNSPEQMSMLVYSRKVKDKHAWAECFNIGTIKHGAVRRPKKITMYPMTQFRQKIREHTDILYKQVAAQCSSCRGSGIGETKRKDGTPRKTHSNCHSCGGSGILYTTTKEIAGFKFNPRSAVYVKAGGFATNREIFKELLPYAKKEEGRKFLTEMVEFNAISTYRNTHIDGLRKALKGDELIHQNFMQAVTATGRLASTAPNLHNLPRGESGFPIRKVFSSRWRGGKIVKGDYAQLEFRAAVELAQDEQGMADIEEGIDVHQYTADTISGAGQPTSRQEAKAHTFKPLYRGTSGTGAERGYYENFKEKYAGINTKHEEWLSEAISRAPVTLPSGREYLFPGAKRYPSGYVSGETQICNYPVQGFATADIVPLATIKVWELLKSCRSCIVNEVHDEIVIDCHPDEVDIVPQLLYDGMMSVPELLKEWYDYELKVPLDVEIGVGPNWLECETWQPS